MTRLVLALGIVMGLAAPAAAQAVAMLDARPNLAWRAPAGCPDLAELRQRVERRLDRTLDNVVVPIEVDVAQAGGRYVARVDLRAVTVANDVRTLTARHCSELADAVAVIVARVAGEAIARQRIAARDGSEEPAAIILEAAPLPPQPRTWTLGARVSGVSGIGVLPKVGLAAEGAVTLRRNDLLVEVSGTRWFTSVAQMHDGAPAKVYVGLDVAAARIGWRPAKLPVRAWSSIEAGHMGGNNIKLPSQQLESGRWLAAGGGFGIAWQMAPWCRLIGSTEAMLALDRVRFTLGDGIVVYAPSPMSVRTLLGLEVGWQ